MSIPTLLDADIHDQVLAENTAPKDWVNPKPAPMYSMVAVGGGSAGLIVSLIVASLGGKVALVEQGFMGGDCLVTGCVPSKSVIRPARLAQEMREAANFGLSAQEITPQDFPAIMQRLRRIRAQISVHDSAKRYTGMGVDVFRGKGVFTGPNTLEVNGQVLHFRKAAICSGARAMHPKLQGLDDVGFLTNESIFNLTTLPEHLIVIGGGPIGCELAQAFRRLGSKVTIIQKTTFLPNEDPKASALLADVFAHEGIEVLLHADTLRAEKNADGKKVLIVKQHGKEIAVVGDEILIGAGRVPNVDGFGLEAAGVDYTPRGIVVDDNLRTSNKDIFAAGDCCMAWKFTHAADAAAQIVVQNALFKGRKRLSSLVMPWCTYTDPEIAHVGMYEKDAQEQGIAVEFFSIDMSEIDRAVADGETQGFVKIMVKKGSDKILGATIVSSHAGEMISEITTAMVGGIGLGKMGDVIHPYPTQASAIKRVAGLYKKSKLTPTVAKLLRWWLNRGLK